MVIRFAKLADLNQINIIRKEVNELHAKGAPKVFKSGFSKDIENYAKEYINSKDKFLLILY